MVLIIRVYNYEAESESVIYFTGKYHTGNNLIDLSLVVTCTSIIKSITAQLQFDVISIIIWI